MTLQGLRVRDALGFGGRQQQSPHNSWAVARRRSPDATDTCRGMVAGVFQRWKGLQTWVALGRELDWRRAAPCRESEPGVSPPRLQHQPAMLLPPSSPQPAPFLSGDFFSFVGRGGRGRWSTEGKEGAPALKAEVLSLQWGTALQLPPNHPSPARPGPADSPEGLSSLVFSFVVLSGWPRSQRTLPSPVPPSLRTPAPGLTEGGGTGLPSEQRRGPSPKTRLGGPPGSLGRASLSGPFGPCPQGGPQNRPGRHLAGGRGRGLRAPRMGAGKNLP